MNSLYRVLPVIFCLFFVSSLGFAQTGKLSGYVTDAKTKEALIGVTVRVGDSASLGSVTDLDGFYSIDEIPVGTYNITATYVGYKPQKKFDIQIFSGNTINLNFELSETSDSLNEVTVKANPFETTAETPNSVNKLSQVEIAKYPGGNNDIAKVVQSLPGVSGSVAGFRNDIIIRGGAPNENVYYLDEIEIPNINHFATQGAAGGPVGIINVSFIEDVTLYSSAFPAEYDNPLSGAIYFKQKDGNPEEIQGNLRISSSEFGLTVEGPFSKKSKKTTFVASVRRSYLDLLFQVIDLPFLPEYWDYQYKINHKIDEKNTLRLIGIGSIDDFQFREPDPLEEGSTREDTIDYLGKKVILETLPVQRQITNTVGVSWRRLIPEGFFTLAVSNNLLQNRLYKHEDNDESKELIRDRRYTELETKARFNYNKFVGDYTISAGGNLCDARYSTDIFNQFQQVGPNGNLQQIVNDFETQLNFIRFGAFFNVSRDFFKERLKLNAGFRVDGNTFMDGALNPLPQFAPRFNALYSLTDKWQLSFTTGRYFKIPPYTVLGFRDRVTNELVNQNTDYISCDHLVGGVTFLPRVGTKVSVEGFYKSYGNYPVSLVDSLSLANQGGGFGVLGEEEVVSNGQGRAYGVEFLFQQKLTKNFYAILAYTLYRSEFTDLAGNYEPASWDNRHLISFTGGYKLPRNWELGLRWRLLGGAPFTPVDLKATKQTIKNQGQTLDRSRFNDERLRAFHAGDIRITKTWNFNKFSLQGFLEIQNFYARQQPSPPEYALLRDVETDQIVQPEQLIDLRQVDNSAVLPNLGIVVEF